jgi:hypothetical protein
MMSIRKTVLAGLGAVCLLAGASQGWAQSPAPSSTQADVEALQALNHAAAALAVGTQAIPTDQLALGDRFVRAMNLHTGLDEILSQALAPAKTQILASVANAPPERKAKFMAAVDEALAGVRRDMLNQVIQGLNRYYAARLTAAQLNDALGFYESALGQKSVRTPSAMTEAETQEAGLYALHHPAVFEVMGAVGGSMEVSQTLSARETARMGDRFKVRLCAAMKARGLESGGCPKA